MVQIPRAEQITNLKQQKNMEANYFIQINEKNRSIMLEPCNAFKAVRLLNFFSDGINLLKETQEVTSIELYKIGELLPKRILI